jgi:hypothetical protein
VIQSDRGTNHWVTTLAGAALLLAVSGCSAASPSATTSGGASEPVGSGAGAVSGAPSAEPSTGPLGGGLILVHEGYDEQNPSPLDVFALDAGTGHRTLLGTLPEGWGGTSRNRYNFQWGADGQHVLVTDFQGQWFKPLENPTDAAHDLTFVCCEPAREALPNGEGTQALYANGWVLSPQSDRVAGLKEREIDVPGCLGCSAPGAVVILDVDGGNLRTLPLPADAQAMGPISWSPDGTAVVISGCRPCNNAGTAAGAQITPPSGDWAKLTPYPAVEHAHLFVVPVDGSLVQERLDEAETSFWSAAWSPDGTTIAFGSHECPPDEHAPDCFEGTFTLETLVVADARRTAVAEGAADFGLGFIWSPNGRRMALGDDSSIFVMDADGSHRAKVADARWSETTWSPDGEWLLFSTYDEALGTSSGPWIIAADGGEPRLLGSYGGWAW